jgi:hypothetical protein
MFVQKSVLGMLVFADHRRQTVFIFCAAAPWRVSFVLRRLQFPAGRVETVQLVAWDADVSSGFSR